MSKWPFPTTVFSTCRIQLVFLDGPLYYPTTIRPITRPTSTLSAIHCLPHGMYVLKNKKNILLSGRPRKMKTEYSIETAMITLLIIALFLIFSTLFKHKIEQAETQHAYKFINGQRRG